MDFIIKLVVVCLFLAILIGPKLLRAIAATKAVQTWFKKNATEFLSGHVRAEHPLFRAAAKKLTHEPDGPGPVKHGVLWNIGQGQFKELSFLLFKHSPSVRRHHPTWRVVVEGSTGLEAGEVLVISGRYDKVFDSGTLAKNSMTILPITLSWEWAQVRAKGIESTSKWLTGERGEKLRSLLTRGRALHIYSNFIMFVTIGNDVIQFATQCLDHSSELIERQSSVVFTVSDTIEDRVDWYPMRRSHYWDKIEAQTDKKRWLLRSEPDSVVTLVTSMFVIGYLVLLGVSIFEGTVDSSYIVGGVLVAAIASYGIKVRRRSWQVAELDLESNHFRRGYGRSFENCTDIERYDLSSAVALQILKDMSQISSRESSSSISGRTLISLELNLVFEDGSRLHLMEFPSEEFYDDEENFQLPELVTEIKNVSGLPVLQFT
jgi:hypothetical protein